MMQPNQTNVLYWLGRLSGHMDQFQSSPTQANQSALLIVLSEYQKEVQQCGLQIPITIPPPIRESKTMSEWYRRQLNEALAMFKINPSDDRMNVMKDHLKGYLDAVAMGRVRP